MIKKTCIHCGAEFEAQRNSAKFCSDKCRKAHKRNNRHDKICPVCGKHFIGTSNMKYCSRECYLINRKINIRENHNPKNNPINNPINNPKYNYKYSQRAKQSANVARQNNPDVQLTINSKRELEYVYGTSECENDLYKIESKKPIKTTKSKFADLL